MSMYSQKEPYPINLNQGDSAYICQCGQTQKPPYCDGSHIDHAPTQPLEYIAKTDETLYVCGCGKTGNAPWCDGSHTR